ACPPSPRISSGSTRPSPARSRTRRRRSRTSSSSSPSARARPRNGEATSSPAGASACSRRSSRSSAALRPSGSTRRPGEGWPGAGRGPSRACGASPARGRAAPPSSTGASARWRTAVPVDVLAISAHPDDVELTCGGTLASLKSRGYKFGIVDLTRGEMGTRGTAEIRAAEAARAAEILGAEFRETLDLGDGGLRRDRDAEPSVIDVIRRQKPRLTFTPYPDDRHPDHRRAGQVVTDAAYYAGLRRIETGHAAHRPQQTLYFSTFQVHEPDFLVDVTPFMEVRRAAMRA